MKIVSLILFTISTFTNVCYASFPITDTLQISNDSKSNYYQMLFNQHIIRTDFQRPVISMFPSYLTIKETEGTLDSEEVPISLQRDDWNNNNYGNSFSSIA